MVDLQRQYRILKDDITLPIEIDGCKHVYHQFTIRIKNRDRVMNTLTENNISSAIYYPVPLHKQEAFTCLNISGEHLPNSEMCASEVLALPMFPELKKDEILFICNVINHEY